MNKVVPTALFSAIYLSCGIYTTEPLRWETIPRISQTTELKPSYNSVKTELKPLVLNYKPIEPTHPAREFTQGDAELLMRVAYAEAGNQGTDGMELIMAVILNRVDSSEFPDTIESVITQKSQFSTVSSGKYKRVELTSKVHEALASIERGEPYDSEVIGFETTANGRTLEKYFKYAYTVGEHDFYVTKNE